MSAGSPINYVAFPTDPITYKDSHQDRPQNYLELRPLILDCAKEDVSFYDLAHGENAREVQVWKQTILDSSVATLSK